MSSSSSCSSGFLANNTVPVATRFARHDDSTGAIYQCSLWLPMMLQMFGDMGNKAVCER